MLTVPERVTYLQSQELVASLSPAGIEALARRMGERDFAAGEALFREGDPGDTIYFIVSGQVEIYKGEETSPTILAVLEAHDLFGDMAVFGEGVRTTSARARSPLVVLFLKEKAIKILIQNSPETAFGFFRILSDRLKRMNEYVTALTRGGASRATLAVVAGPDQGKTVSMVGNRLEIGRSAGSPLLETFRMSLDDPSAELARRHAEIVFQEGGFFLRDLGGKGGTRLNGEPIEEPVALQTGDRIGVGGNELRFDLPAGGDGV
ncbi:MAG: cyclic nucleotide-binding domain-containing protein [Planctomycetes bacterium]|nr:cyclic nucleotide-binding domain-containing protein [Planctomycetota bacterium]